MDKDHQQEVISRVGRLQSAAAVSADKWVYTPHQGLINYTDTKAKCRHLKKLTRTLLQVFIRVLQTGDTVCHVGIFDLAL
jgi:hypothetical protein